MGEDKALLPLGGEPMAARVARALRSVAYPVLAVGMEAGTGLDAIADPREGPLVALVAGADALRARGHEGPVLALACDLPFVTAGALGVIAASLGDADAAVPVEGGRDQSLCACYAPAALDAARALVASERRAMRDLLAAVRVRRLALDAALGDVDTPDEYARARRQLEG